MCFSAIGGLMSNKDYTEVTCKTEVPDRPFFVVGSKYSATSSNHGKGPQMWVGIPGQGGHYFSMEDFQKYFS